VPTVCIPKKTHLMILTRACWQQTPMHLGGGTSRADANDR